MYVPIGHQDSQGNTWLWHREGPGLTAHAHTQPSGCTRPEPQPQFPYPHPPRTVEDILTAGWTAVNEAEMTQT